MRKMKKAIVTGANGFVGSAICKELCDRGVYVTAIVRDEDSSTRLIDAIKGLNIVYLDMSAIYRLDEIIDGRDYDCFYHMAWTGSAGGLRGDYSVQLKNVESTCEAVKVAKRLGCEKFVFAASIMEYEVQKLMETETTIGIGTMYSTAKITAEYMARAMADKVGICYVGGVISNIYGPGEKSPRLINSTIRKLLSGEFCEFSPGEQLYDFIYIEDAAKAFVALGNYGKANRSYYIGTQAPRPLKEFLRELRDIVAPGVEIGLGAIPFNGVSLDYTEFDINALAKDCKFVPSVSFADGIRKTSEWIRDELENGKL